MVQVFTDSASRNFAGASMRRRLGFLLSLAAAWFVVPTFAATFTTSLDRETVLVGESVGLTLTFEGGSLQGSPGLPAIPGIQIAPGTSSGMSSTMGPDGKMTVVNTYKFTLVATQPGEITIPSFQVDLNGQRLSSQPLKLKVLSDDASAPPAELGRQNMFLWPAIPKRDFYLREPVIVEIRLYVRNGVNAALTEPGEFVGDGFPRAKFQPGQRFSRRVGNVPFTVVPFLALVTPTKTGEVKTEPWSYTLVLNPRGAFDFESILTRRPPPQEVPLKLDSQTLRVLPLPTNNVPASFNGAVGTFELSVTAGPTNVTVGDPITVRIQLTGRGALDALTLPEQPEWKEFKTYSTTSKIETSDPLGLQGSKLFEQVVAPQNADLKAIPPVEFSFFDPERKVYRTLKQPALPLSIRGATTVAPVISAAKPATADAPPPTQDIVGIKQRLGVLAATQGPLPLRPWFWGLQTVPLLAWLGAVVWRKRADALANNPRLRRRRHVAQLVHDGLAELRKLAGENKSDAFFATLVHVLQEQIGERVDLPASAITEAIIEERLKPAGLEAGPCGELHELFQACNLARYAPVQSSQELAALVPRLEAVIQQLRRFEA